jgi:cell division protein FtsZ
MVGNHGIVNLDFADVASVLKEAGYAYMGVGEGKGNDKAEIAAKMAVTSPLLETAMSGATGILINITASPDISLDEVETASALVSGEAHPDATIIWGLAFDEKLENTIKITVIATGLKDADKE